MKKIKLNVSKCLKCHYRVISDGLQKTCPICKNRMTEDSSYPAHGYDTGENAFIGFKKRVRKDKSK